MSGIPVSKKVVDMVAWREHEFPSQFSRDLNALIQRGKICKDEIPRRTLEKKYVLMRDETQRRVSRRIGECLNEYNSVKVLPNVTLHLGHVFADLLHEPNIYLDAVAPILHGYGNPMKLQLAGAACLLLAGMYANPYRIAYQERELELYVNRGSRFYWLLTEKIELPEYMRGQDIARRWLVQKHHAAVAAHTFGNLFYLSHRI